MWTLDPSSPYSQRKTWEPFICPCTHMTPPPPPLIPPPSFLLTGILHQPLSCPTPTEV